MRTRLMPVSAISSVMNESWVDVKRCPYVTGEGAYIPVRDGFEATHILQSRRRTGRGYQRLGDVIVFHGEKPTSHEIDNVTSREHPRGVLWIAGHEGVMRRPQITLLCGSAGEVCHRESGINYHLDVQKIMFSQGNREEKSRISGMIRPGEKVCDMFAGIGYFTLGMARAGANVHAMEINPESYHYLNQNIRVNGLSGKIRADQGDCRDLLTGFYDRIHMGHFEAISFLSKALAHTGSGSVLHVHMINDRSELIQDCLSSGGYTGEISIHRIKKVGPRQMHLVADVVVS